MTMNPILFVRDIVEPALFVAIAVVGIVGRVRGASGPWMTVRDWQRCGGLIAACAVVALVTGLPTTQVILPVQQLYWLGATVRWAFR